MCTKVVMFLQNEHGVTEAGQAAVDTRRYENQKHYHLQSQCKTEFVTSVAFSSEEALVTSFDENKSGFEEK
ncbi:hypothetical protein MTR_8g080830 [Medicago truncatula]|uniref:Uncharacterized protein n=1 Tax=Medicago truncatula TaxID=3880 RepID=A0A072TT60_MEDTR|nr:hypothetical protein MTR_8g080830 [Medicago truncatula]